MLCFGSTYEKNPLNPFIYEINVLLPSYILSSSRYNSNPQLGFKLGVAF